MSLDAEISDKMDLDTKWIEEFESVDNNYKTFYRRDLDFHICTGKSPSENFKTLTNEILSSEGPML